MSEIRLSFSTKLNFSSQNRFKAAIVPLFSYSVLMVSSCFWRVVDWFILDFFRCYNKMTSQSYGNLFICKFFLDFFSIFVVIFFKDAFYREYAINGAV